jgi:hypothetical protein
MSKKAEHTAWAEIERRLGPNVLLDGERTRPTYLGTLINLEPNREEAATRELPEVPEKNR